MIVSLLKVRADSFYVNLILVNLHITNFVQNILCEFNRVNSWAEIEMVPEGRHKMPTSGKLTTVHLSRGILCAMSWEKIILWYLCPAKTQLRLHRCADWVEYFLGMTRRYLHINIIIYIFNQPIWSGAHFDLRSYRVHMVGGAFLHDVAFLMMTAKLVLVNKRKWL